LAASIERIACQWSGVAIAEIVVCGAVFVAVGRIYCCLGPYPVLRIDVADSKNAKVVTGKKITEIVHALVADLPMTAQNTGRQSSMSPVVSYALGTIFE